MEVCIYCGEQRAYLSCCGENHFEEVEEVEEVEEDACLCRQGECESKPIGCRMAAEVQKA